MSRFPASFRNPKSSINCFFAVSRHSKTFMGLVRNFNSNALSFSFVLSNHLRNGRLDEARTLFDNIPSPSVHLSTKMILGYLGNCRLDDALKLFDKMPHRDTVCWNSVIKGCFDCGDMRLAKTLFNEMPERNVVSWTTMVNGYLQFGCTEVAEELFREMPGKDIAAWNSMIHGYFSNGRINDALKLFEVMPRRNVISWTSMISGLDQHGRSEEALFLFRHMVASGVEPTASTFASVITASANVAALRLGTQAHAKIVMLGYNFDPFVTASLVTLYANCKHVDDSCKVFSEKLHMNVVVWTSLLTGYGVNCKHGDALKVFSDMIRMRIFPNQSSFTSALNSCCEQEDVEKGEEIHAVAVKLGLEAAAFVANSLIVLYSRCGRIRSGMLIFEEIGHRNVVSWNSIIVGCAQHGRGEWAVALFTRMIRTGMQPDEITLTGLLSSCNHSGMLRKGRSFFQYFSRCKSIELKLEHYACMVDILGRSGKLDEAENLIRNMPMKANTTIWLALLSASATQHNLEMAEKAANCIFNIDSHCSAAYVLLSNLYASSGRWSDAARVREKMKQQGVVKQPGQSWFNLKGMTRV